MHKISDSNLTGSDIDLSSASGRNISFGGSLSSSSIRESDSNFDGIEACILYVLNVYAT